MKKILSKTVYMTLLGTFLALVALTQIGFSDSFVDESIITSWDEYTPGTPMDKNTMVTPTGDSFVDDALMATLNNPEVGQANDYTAMSYHEHFSANDGDSFVDAEMLRAIEADTFDNCIAECN
jgi:hypothetical protein